MNEHTSRWESIRTINYPDYGEGDSYVVAFANVFFLNLIRKKKDLFKQNFLK